MTEMVNISDELKSLHLRALALIVAQFRWSHYENCSLRRFGLSRINLLALDSLVLVSFQEDLVYHLL